MDDLLNQEHNGWENKMTRFPGRNRSYDAYICLLVWDVLGSALASTQWDELVTLLAGGVIVSNAFTMTLVRCIESSRWLQAHLEVVLREAASIYAAADALKAWFETLLAQWIDKMAVGRKTNAAMTQVFNGLIQNAYGLIVWEHVARAFRHDY